MNNLINQIRNLNIQRIITIGQYAFTTVGIPILVYILFKGILLGQANLLRLHILVPFISAISACLVHAIRMLHLGKKIDQAPLLVFSLSFITSVLLLGLKLIYFSDYNLANYDWIWFFSVLFAEWISFEIQLGTFKANILCMDKANSGSSANSGITPGKVNSGNSSAGQSNSKPELYNFGIVCIRITELLSEMRSLNKQLDGFINNMVNLKSVNDIRYLEEDNNLSLDIPSTMPPEKYSELTKKVGILDSLFTRQCEAFEQKSALISALREEGTKEGYTNSKVMARQWASHIERNQQIKNRFNALLEKE